MVGSTEHLTVELAAVWDEMFDGVAAIMKAAERIDALINTVPGPLSNDIAIALADIFQACAFQDITGQRIAKVVGALSTHGGHSEHAAFAPRRTANDDGLLNGPQLPGQTLNQEAIDDLFSGFVAKGC